MPAAAAPTAKKPTGPGYYDLIKEAVLALKERQGSSRFAIDKYVANKKGASYSKSRLNIALKKGVETGKLVAVKGSFKLAADEKKAATKKPAAKKATTVGKKSVKKATAPKKKTVKSVKKVSRKKPTASKKKVVKKSTAAAAKKAKKSVTVKKVAAKKN